MDSLKINLFLFFSFYSYQIPLNRTGSMHYSCLIYYHADNNSDASWILFGDTKILYTGPQNL